MEKAKAARDEAIAMTDSLKSEQERLIRVAKKEVEEEVARAVFERDGVIKALKLRRPIRRSERSRLGRRLLGKL